MSANVYFRKNYIETRSLKNLRKQVPLAKKLKVETDKTVVKILLSGVVIVLKGKHI